MMEVWFEKHLPRYFRRKIPSTDEEKMRIAAQNDGKILCEYCHADSCVVWSFRSAAQSVARFQKLFFIYFLYHLFRKRAGVRTVFGVLKLYLTFVKRPFTFMYVTCFICRAGQCVCKNNNMTDKKYFFVLSFVATLGILFEGHKRAQELAAYCFSDFIISIWKHLKAKIDLDESSEKTFDHLAYAFSIALAISFFLCGGSSVARSNFKFLKKLIVV